MSYQKGQSPIGLVEGDRMYVLCSPFEAAVYLCKGILDYCSRNVWGDRYKFLNENRCGGVESRDSRQKSMLDDSSVDVNFVFSRIFVDR
jgi:hypothetical protein